MATTYVSMDAPMGRVKNNSYKKLQRSKPQSKFYKTKDGKPLVKQGKINPRLLKRLKNKTLRLLKRRQGGAVRLLPDFYELFCEKWATWKQVNKDNLKAIIETKSAADICGEMGC